MFKIYTLSALIVLFLNITLVANSEAQITNFRVKFKIKYKRIHIEYLESLAKKDREISQKIDKLMLDNSQRRELESLSHELQENIQNQEIVKDIIRKA